MQVCAVLLALTVPAAAQPLGAPDQPLITPEDAHQLRELRSIERRSVTDPAGAARDAGAASRRVVRDAKGVDFTPEQARVYRQLHRLRAVEPGPEGAAASPREVGDPLPSSYDDRGAPLPSMRDPLRTAGLLLDRAEGNIADGRVASARSDLSLAESELAIIEGSGAAGDRAEAMATAKGRLAALRQRLTP
jgi:hypothetical protein